MEASLSTKKDNTSIADNIKEGTCGSKDVRMCLRSCPDPTLPFTPASHLGCTSHNPSCKPPDPRYEVWPEWLTAGYTKVRSMLSQPTTYNFCCSLIRAWRRVICKQVTILDRHANDACVHCYKLDKSQIFFLQLVTGDNPVSLNIFSNHNWFKHTTVWCK